MAASGGHGREGFALMVAVVLIAVFAVLATVVAISLSGDNDQDRIEAVADELHRISSELDSVSTTSANFRGDMPKYPATLSQLTHRPWASSAIDKTCTGTTWNATNVAAWRGPYHVVPISPNGHYLAAGFVASNTILFPTANDLSIQIPNVSLNDATLLDNIVDGTSDLNAGTVRYSSTGASVGTVSYHKVISGC